jgi:1-acyl-sn-glycerol-3-phosphate acyltransferase
MKLRISNSHKYIILIIKILLIIISLIAGRKYYLEPFYNFIENYYSSRFNVIGRENIPKDNGYVIISNHNFTSEVFIIKNIISNFSIIVKKSLFSQLLNTNNKLFIFYDKSYKNIQESGKIIKNKINKIIKNKNNVLIFPEGDFSIANSMQLFKKGLFYLCYEKNIPILPIIICIKKQKYKASFFCLDSKIKVKIFEMIYPNKFKNFNQYYNYIYNLMNEYLKKYINNPNIKLSILI